MSAVRAAPLWLEEDQVPSSGRAPKIVHARAAPFLPDYTYTGPAPPRHARESRARRVDAVPDVGRDRSDQATGSPSDPAAGSRSDPVTGSPDAAVRSLLDARSIVIGGVPDPGAADLVLPGPLAPSDVVPSSPAGYEVPEWVRGQVHRLWAVAQTVPTVVGGLPERQGSQLILPDPAPGLVPIHHRALLRLVLPGSEFSDVTGRHGVFDPGPRRITAHLVVAPTHASPKRVVEPTIRTARVKPAPKPAVPLNPAFRRSPWWQATAGGLALAIGVPAAAMIAPTALGGDTSWTIVVGHSMEPTLDPGDLVFTRAQDTYGVGDVVVYTIPDGTAGAGVMIIHRIVGGDAQDGFITQGDNRERPDPWRPTPDLITGRHWRTVDHGGNVVVWLRSPLAMAALLGATAFVGTLEMARKEEAEEAERA